VAVVRQWRHDPKIIKAGSVAQGFSRWSTNAQSSHLTRIPALGGAPAPPSRVFCHFCLGTDTEWLGADLSPANGQCRSQAVPMA